MPVSSYHFLIGPLVAVAALAVLLLICRWVFSTSHRDQRATVTKQAPRPGDFGLLVPIATAPTPADAAMLRQVLAEAGIRATVSGAEVLVFRADAARARGLVSS